MEPAIAASSIAAGPAAPTAAGSLFVISIPSDKILEWCFTVGALNLGALGFLYSIYATALLNFNLNPKHGLPPVLSFLVSFCYAIVGVLSVLSIVAVYNACFIQFSVSVWLIIGCLVVLTVYSFLLVKKMKGHE